MPFLKFISVTESYLFFFFGHLWHINKGLNCLPLTIHRTNIRKEDLVKDGLELDSTTKKTNATT